MGLEHSNEKVTWALLMGAGSIIMSLLRSIFG